MADDIKTQNTITKNLSFKEKMRYLNKQKARQAIRWLFNKYGRKIARAGVPEEAFNLRINGDTFIGGMFIYGYDPKWKDKLPWYDTLPVVIPISILKDGRILGLNLHYLPPMLRAQLLDILVDYKRRAGTPRAYMQLSYQMLKGIASHRLIAPCIHSYLPSHITTNIARIDDEYWEQVCMLPLQQFQKASAEQVWRKGLSAKNRKAK